MRSFIPTILAIMMSVTGCAAALSNAERAELEKLRSADQAARVERAKKDGYRPPGAPQMPATSPTPPAVSPGIGMNGTLNHGGSAAVVETVRGEQPGYLCVAGSEPRQARKGHKIMIVNNYCDGDRDGGLNCADNDFDGFVDNDSYMSFEIDGKPVVVTGGGSQGLLKPKQRCYINVDRTRRVHLTVMRHANMGTRRQAIIDPASPDATFSTLLRLEGNVTNVDLTENDPWSAH
ncbi:MAG: hypothetical protein QY323_04650 [Patescibacteria group bacterium]|nr:MAG: hypothetical protein QY323_04650 [Patescibacteria group bacterium]